jgi:hypothetical protein
LLPAVQNPGGYLLVNPGASGAPGLLGFYGENRTGEEVIVVFLEGNPDQPILVSSPVPSAPGVSVLKSPGPEGAPTLDDVTCIEIGGIWHQSGTCEISGAATASSSFTIPPATTLLVDPGGSLNDNATVTNNGNVTNGGTLTVSGGGTLTVGGSGSLDDNGTLTLAGTATDNGSVTIDPNGTTTIQPAGSLTIGGTLTLNGTLTNNGTIMNNGNFVDQGVFVNNGTCVNC